MNAGRLAADGIREEASTSPTRVTAEVKEAARLGDGGSRACSRSRCGLRKKAAENAERGAIAKEAQQETARAAWVAAPRPEEDAADVARKEAEARGRASTRGPRGPELCEPRAGDGGRGTESIAQAQAWARRKFADRRCCRPVSTSGQDGPRLDRGGWSALVEIAEASGRFKHEWEQIRTAQSSCSRKRSTQRRPQREQHGPHKPRA